MSEEIDRERMDKQSRMWEKRADSRVMLMMLGTGAGGQASKLTETERLTDRD